MRIEYLGIARLGVEMLGNLIVGALSEGKLGRVGNEGSEIEGILKLGSADFILAKYSTSSVGFPLNLKLYQYCQ